MKKGVSAALITAVVVLTVASGFVSLVAAYSPAASTGGRTVSGPSGVHTAGTFYSVKFTETGLPSATEWWVNITNEPPFGSTGTSISTALPNGNYTYTVASDNLQYASNGGSFTINGSGVSIGVPFALVTFPVYFNQTGLPGGTTWWANISGEPALSSTGASIEVMLPNASYTYTIATTDKQYAATGGSFTIAGAGVSEAVVFGLVTYAVTFTEHNLPTGTEWFINLSGEPSLNSTGHTISTALPNGTYTYTVATVNKDYAASGSSVNVHGASVSKSVPFTLVTYTVTIGETGLPAGTEWWANLTGEPPFGSTGTTITTSLPNGTYPYLVATANKSWVATGGTFTVNGASLEVSVAFSLVTYNVTFTESGLPAATTWWVNLTGPLSPSLSSSSTSVSSQLPNGTYAFTLGSANKRYSASAASFAVDGASVNVSVPFGLITYAVTFTETGLPGGVSWFINLTGGGSQSSSTPTISFVEPNGTYPYTVGSANRSYAAVGGSFTVNGAPFSGTETFALVTYTVSFAETGLPGGATWWANLTNGQTGSSTGSSIGYVEPNGTYTYTIQTTAKKVEASGGMFTVHGSGLTVPVAFGPVTLSVTFTETGLPVGKSWTAELNGTSRTVTGTSTTFQEVNGSLPYLLSGPGGWRVSGTAPSGLITVAGSPVSVSFSFVKGPTYTIHFGESGLPKGEVWCVTLGGATVCPTTSSQVFADLTPGSYAYSIGSKNGQAITAKVGGVGVPLSGSLGIATKSLAVAIKYVYDYTVSFHETGLPTGTSWSVTLKGVTVHSTTASLQFSESNGSYGYKVGAETGYKVSGSPTKAVVTGADVSVAVTFTAKPSGPAAVPAVGLARPSVRTTAVVGVPLGAVLVAEISAMLAALFAARLGRPRTVGHNG